MKARIIELSRDSYTEPYGSGYEAEFYRFLDKTEWDEVSDDDFKILQNYVKDYNYNHDREKHLVLITFHPKTTSECISDHLNAAKQKEKEKLEKQQKMLLKKEAEEKKKADKEKKKELGLLKKLKEKYANS